MTASRLAAQRTARAGPVLWQLWKCRSGLHPSLIQGRTVCTGHWGPATPTPGGPGPGDSPVHGHWAVEDRVADRQARAPPCSQP